MHGPYFSFFPFIWKCGVVYALITDVCQAYSKKGAASFKNLGPILPEPLALVYIVVQCRFHSLQMG